ncbi:MAG: hypothetical protein IIC71_11390 [Acidobacteria bacterium]|nr:hypothetical protein [Acidobacteriota bacterium]
MSLADGSDRLNVVVAGVTTSGDGRIVLTMSDPKDGDTPPAQPLQWWAARLPGTKSN